MGPWARVLFITVNGTDGDGAITLVLGIVAGLLAVVRLARPAVRGVMFVAGLAFIGAAAVGVWDWADLGRVASDTSDEDSFFSFSVQVGWGLIVMTIASIAGAILSAADAFRRPGSLSRPPTLTDQPEDPRPRQRIRRDPFASEPSDERPPRRRIRRDE
jgi:hypothetical protein